jgi:hypothetical protein
MRSLWQFVKDTLATGGAATAATSAVAAWCGRLETGRTAAPINAVSHIVWGDKAAAEQDDPSLQYTAVGAGLNAAAVTGWAAMHELIVGDGRRSRHPAAALASGVAVSAAAYITDYYVVPKRLTPGFELRLSNTSLLAIYSTLAVSLAVGGLLKPRRGDSTSRRAKPSLGARQRLQASRR